MESIISPKVTKLNFNNLNLEQSVASSTCGAFCKQDVFAQPHSKYAIRIALGANHKIKKANSNTFLIDLIILVILSLLQRPNFN